MWYKKIKINTEDRMFSEYIRTRDDWHCQYRFICFGVEDFRYNKGQLHCSHFIKRGKWSTRYDIENCDAACNKCHNFVENHKDGQKKLEEWKKKQLGEQAYNRLILRGNTSDQTVRYPLLVRKYIKKLMKELKPNA